MYQWMRNLLTLKPYVHVLIALGLWIFAVILLAFEQNNTMMLKLDQLRTYALNKIPFMYDGVGGARATIITNFNTQWTIPNDDIGCFALVNWTGNAACATKRNLLVTSTRSAMGCDIYRAPGCNCANQVLKAIANDTNPNVNLPNTFTGVFSTLGRNVTGQQANILAALDACHFMHHPVYVAVETANGNTMVRRVSMLFILTTFVTGNAVLYFLFVGAAEQRGFNWMPRIIAILLWPIISGVVPVVLEGGATNIVILILLPPLLILFWYEWVVLSPHKTQFMHPYFFAVIMATLSVISLVENSVFDYDNIVFEIWKSHMVSCLYFGVLWFSSKAQLSSNEKHRGLYLNRPQQVLRPRPPAPAHTSPRPLTVSFAGRAAGGVLPRHPVHDLHGHRALHVGHVHQLPPVVPAHVRADLLLRRAVDHGRRQVQGAVQREAEARERIGRAPAERGAAPVQPGAHHRHAGLPVLLARLFDRMARDAGEHPHAVDPAQRDLLLAQPGVLIRPAQTGAGAGSARRERRVQGMYINPAGASPREYNEFSQERD